MSSGSSGDRALSAVSRLRDVCACGARGPDARRFEAVVARLTSCASSGLTGPALDALAAVWTERDADLPYAKWAAVGRTMVPEGAADPRAVNRVVKWIRTKAARPDHKQKVTFALQWLQGLLEYNLLDPSALEHHYGFFFFLLNSEHFGPIAAKFVHFLSQQYHVTKSKASQILRAAKRHKLAKCSNALYAVLNLFMSFNPECLSDNIPGVSPADAFPKINASLADSFREAKNRRNIEMGLTSESRIAWWIPSSKRGAKPSDSLIPNVQYLWQITPGKEMCHDFQSETDLLFHDLANSLEIPTRMLSLLVNDSGLYMIKLANSKLQSRFSHNLYHTLYNNYLQDNKVSYTEKKIFLQRILSLHKHLMQGIPVVSRLLALYISTWNGHDFFDEIMSLLEWIVFDSFEELFDCILSPIETLYFTNNTNYRCAVVQMLRKLYVNIHRRIFSDKSDLFLSRKNTNNLDSLEELTVFINDLCQKSYDIKDHLVLRNAYIDLYTDIANLELACDKPLWTVAPEALIYGVLCSFSAQSIDRIAKLFLSYHKIYEKIKSTNGKEDIRNQIVTFTHYNEDYMNCLWYGRSLSRSGLLFKKLPITVMDEVLLSIENCQQLLHLCIHPAFAPYTYMKKSPDVLCEFAESGMLLAMMGFENISVFIDTITK